MLTTGDNIYAGRRCSAFRSAAPATKTTTGSSPISSRIATSSTAFRCIRRSAITTRTKPRSATIARRSKTTSTCASALLGEEAAGRASFGPGLFYRFRYGSDIEFVCIDTSKEDFFRGKRLFEYPKHWEFVEQSFPPRRRALRWRIPFAHHPLFSAGPQHHNTRGMDRAAAAVRALRRAGDVHRSRAQLPALARRRARPLRDRRGRQGPAHASRSLRSRRTPCRGPRTVTSCWRRSSGDRMTRARDRRDRRSRGDAGRHHALRPDARTGRRRHRNHRLAIEIYCRAIVTSVCCRLAIVASTIIGPACVASHRWRRSVHGARRSPPPWAYTVNPPPAPGAKPAPRPDPAPQHGSGQQRLADDRADA